jgi:hypothetical protein
MSGPSRNWVKVKCPDSKRDNAERFRMFQGQSKPPPSERERALKKKREELSRVRERVQALRKHQAILEQEIAELEQA